MQTSVNVSTQWADSQAAPEQKIGLYKKWIAFEDSQAPNLTLWYLVSMMFQGVLFLPIPALLIYYFNAPVGILFATLTMFFSNIIAGMAGLGIRAIISFFGFSVLLHLTMLAIFIL